MRRKIVLGLVTALVLCAAGCGLGETPPAEPAPSTTSDAPSAAPSMSTQPTPADPSQPSAPDQLGEPVVTRTSAADGEKIQLTLYPVVRDGQVSHVNLILSAPEEDADRVQIADLLGDANSTTSDFTLDSADGLQLVDGKNAKVYLVASDGNGHCLCTRNLNNLYVEYGNPVLMSASFAAPPADVTVIQVRIPNFGTVKNVPVQ
jgi:hypothetical protein